jgi:hypothetical protein
MVRSFKFVKENRGACVGARFFLNKLTDGYHSSFVVNCDPGVRVPVLSQRLWDSNREVKGKRES